MASLSWGQEASMRDAISYKRFSSPRQARGYSNQRQADLAQDYCQRHNLRLVDTYLDAGLSAFTGQHLTDRGALRELLEAAKVGKFKRGTRLIVEALDRLSRQEISVALRLFLDILDAGLVIVTLIDGEQVFTKERVDADVTAIIIAIVCLSRSNNEARVKRERALHAQLKARQKARERLIPITAECPRWLALLGQGDERHFVVDQSRARVIRHIFQLAASGMGQLHLARYLNEHRVETFSGKGLWRPGMIAHLLQNRAVLGLFQPHLSVVDGGRRRRRPDPDGPILGYFPAIVEEELFNKTQLATQGRRRHHGQRVVPARSNLVTRLGRCALCDGPLYLSQTMDGFAYLRCANVRERVCANKLGFPYRKLEAVLLRLDQLMELAARLISTVRPDASSSGEGQAFSEAPQTGINIGEYGAFLDRFHKARVRLSSTDIEDRHLARGALVEEFRRLFAGVVLHPERVVTLHTRADGRGRRIIYVLSYGGLCIQIKFDDGVTGMIEPAVLAPLVPPTGSGNTSVSGVGWQPCDLDWLLAHTHVIRSPNGDWQAVLSDPMRVFEVLKRGEKVLLESARLRGARR
jgi:DNA invertase Pin-like site-specific DNA recombinase